MNARRVEVEIIYNGKNISKDLKPYLKNFTYTDDEGSADDIQFTLHNREGKWHGAWMPQKNDTITAAIVTYDWNKEGVKQRLNCGKFFIDSVDFKGPPDELSVKAMSIPLKDGGKSAKRSRTWENSSLSIIAGQVAISCGLTLLYDAPDYTYDRVVQSRETDLGFLKRLARKEGISIKVSNEKLVLYDEKSYESKKSVRKVKRGESRLLNYSFTYEVADKEYKKVQLSYFDSKKKKNIKYVYDVPGVDQGPTLKLNKRANNLAEAKRWAQKAAREKNKRSKSGKLSLVGDPTLVQGITIDTSGFLKFDGKYIIEKTSHSVSNGYVISVDIREVLGY